jgi:fibro-slime domain-containing protein
MGTRFFRFLVPGRPQIQHDVARVADVHPLNNGGYQFSSYSFFPARRPRLRQLHGQPGLGGMYRNFHFTSEVRHWFEYRGGETLSFRGDDDCGCSSTSAHRRLGACTRPSGSVTLDAMNGSAQVCDLLNPARRRRRTVMLGLTVGSVYEIAVFHAERRTNASTTS